MFRTITEKTIDWIVRDLRALGYNGYTLSGVDPDQPTFHNFAGTKFYAECRHETFEGRTREKWGLAGAGEFEPTPLQQGEIYRLDALFNSAFRKAPVSAQAQAQPQRQAEPPINPTLAPPQSKSPAPDWIQEPPPAPPQYIPPARDPNDDIPF
jgi:hypothetical protein